MKISVSVPGKIYLMGEHAVVYGKPALLSAINRRLSVTVEPAGTLDIISAESTDYVRYAVNYVAKEYNLQKPPHVKITVRSNIPAGYHLGSSAAVAVAVVGALTYYLKKVWNPQVANQFAYEIEKKQHGNPSGADNTVISTGGFLWYRKELDFLRSFWQLPMKLSPALNHFYLFDTGRPKETTGEMVGYVHAEYQKHTEYYKKLFDENEEQTKRITVALKEGDEKTMIQTIRKGQQILKKMGVVSNKVTRVIQKIEHAGGAAKILGGGGRKDGAGYLLCYSHHPPAGSIPIMLGEEGIRLEKNI